MCMTSCSDNDDNNSGDNTPGGGSEMTSDITDDEMVLASILENWCDFDPETDLKHGIINKTFEAVEGDVVGDNSRVRTIVVGSAENADKYAVDVLGGLGISSTDPVGFTWTNPEIGTIKYNRSSGNEMGVIEVEVKQIPSLWKLRLVATAEVNAGELPYYSKGDIVMNTKDNKYYICVTDHSYAQQSKWISFDCTAADRQSQKTSTALWINTGYDQYYSQKQADYSSIVTWLSDYILSDTGYDGVIQAFQSSGLNAENIVNQVVPSSQELRHNLISGITVNMEDVILEAWQKVGNDRDPRITRFSYDVIDSKANKWETRLYKPTGLLLAYLMRWNLTSNYWQPYVVLVKTNNYFSFSNLANSVPSQTTLSSTHFAWKELANNMLNMSSSNAINSGLNGNYRICTTAVHWTHDKFQMMDRGKNLDIYGLIDFTKGENTSLNQYDWMRRCVTSRELTYKDKGKNSAFRSIRVQRHTNDHDF